MSAYNVTLQDSWGRANVVNYIRSKKSQQTFRVIDVGASMNGWSHEVVDTIVDFTSGFYASHVKQYKFDITCSEQWEELEKEVEENGKYDFSICTHTLEDIIDPKLVVNKLSNISKAGYIATPSKYIELRKNIEGSYRGFIHHRWFFTFRDGAYFAYPKLNFLEYKEHFEYEVPDACKKYVDLNFFWKDSIELQIINNNFLGPSVNAVLGYYKELNNNDDCDFLIKTYGTN